MTSRFSLLIILVFTLATAALAGTITGTVSPGKSSVVYVDAVSGKTFPAPTSETTDGPEGTGVQPARPGRTGWYYG